MGTPRGRRRKVTVIRPDGSLHARVHFALQRTGQQGQPLAILATVAWSVGGSYALAGLLFAYDVSGWVVGLALLGVIASGPLLYWLGSRLLRSQRRRAHRISDPTGLAHLDRAQWASARIERAWPQLGRMLDASPRPALRQALWELAGELTERTTVLAGAGELGEVLKRLPAGDQTGIQVREQMVRLYAAREVLDARIHARVARLVRLADACELHLAVQQANARTAQARHQADRLLGSGLAG